MKEYFLKDGGGGGRERRGGRQEQQKTKFNSSGESFSASEPSLIPSLHAIRGSHTGTSHLGRYTSTFCFFTEFAHSSISCALTNGSRVASGTSCLDKTSIILISSPSQGISRTWQIPPASLEPSLNSPKKNRKVIKGPYQGFTKMFTFVITFFQNSVQTVKNLGL